MSEKRAYVYKLQAFGAPKVSGGAATRLDINDIFTEISVLAPHQTDVNGRILICRDEVDSDPLFLHVIENDKTKRVVKGIIGVIKSTDLPDEFDMATGTIAPLNIAKDLLEKTHFFIDTLTGYTVIQRSKSSPNTGLLAYYIQKKAIKSVQSFSMSAHIRKDTIEKIKQASAQGKIKMFQLRIQRTALNRVDSLGPEVSTALKSIASLPGVESIGISIGIEKYKRKGGFSTDGILNKMKNFLGMQTSTQAMSDVELAEFRLDDEEINLLTQKFTMQVTISGVKKRNVDSEAILNAMEAEYNLRKTQL
jgi:hypothetical protein